MALPNVTIIVRRDGLGQIAFTNDGIMGLVLTGVAVTDKVQLDTPYSITTLAEAEALGIAELEADGETPGVNLAAWKQIRDFYREAGNGAKLWFIVSNEILMSTNVAADADDCPLKLLLNAANGEISVVGIVRGATQGSTIVDGLNDDVWDTLTDVQLVADEYQGKIMPFSAVIDGLDFSGDADAAEDLKTLTRHRGSILLAAPESDGVAGVGQFIGRLAAIPVQRKVSRVKDGALTNSVGYLTDEAVVENRECDLNSLHDTGYFVYRTFPGMAGFFYSGDSNATGGTDDDDFDDIEDDFVDVDDDIEDIDPDDLEEDDLDDLDDLPDLDDLEIEDEVIEDPGYDIDEFEDDEDDLYGDDDFLDEDEDEDEEAYFDEDLY